MIQQDIKDIKIGQIYKMSQSEDPFQEVTYVKVLDIKENIDGILWVKYTFCYPQDDKSFKNGVLSSSSNISIFLNNYKTYTVNDNELQTKKITNSISELEI